MAQENTKREAKETQVLFLHSHAAVVSRPCTLFYKVVFANTDDGFRAHQEKAKEEQAKKDTETANAESINRATETANRENEKDKRIQQLGRNVVDLATMSDRMLDDSVY